MSYGRWFSLDVEHGYYADGRCLGVEARLDPASARTLAGHRGLARPRPGGVDVLVELEAGADTDRPLISPAPGLSLGFELWIRDAELPLVTDMTQLRALAAPVYAITRDGVSLEDSDATRPTGLLARAVVSGIDASWLADPPRHRVSLTPRSLRWIYYYVAPTAEALAIHDADPDRADAKIEFSSEAAEPSADDRVADELAARYPEHQRVRLISRDLLPCSATPRRRLSLRSIDTTLIDELPNPSPTTVSRPTLDGVTQDVLHCILIR